MDHILSLYLSHLGPHITGFVCIFVGMYLAVDHLTFARKLTPLKCVLFGLAAAFSWPLVFAAAVAALLFGAFRWVKGKLRPAAEPQVDAAETCAPLDITMAAMHLSLEVATSGRHIDEPFVANTYERWADGDLGDYRVAVECVRKPGAPKEA